MVRVDSDNHSAIGERIHFGVGKAVWEYDSEQCKGVREPQGLSGVRCMDYVGPPGLKWARGQSGFLYDTSLLLVRRSQGSPRLALCKGIYIPEHV